MKLEGVGTLDRKMTAIYNNITSSIAFYPIIITLFYLVLVVGMLWFDYSKPAQMLSNEMPWLQFKEMSAVRAILSTLIAGIISLMALSFSMVMVVLNQATNTISPKVMQGLVTRKEHQFVLGNQIGTVLYFMVVLLLLRSIDFYKIPTFSVALGLLLGFWSIGLFVYFIHSISQSIQVTNIITSIYDNTYHVLKHLQENGKDIPESLSAPFETPYKYLTDKPGFLQEINVEGLLKIAKKHNFQIQLEPFFTDYLPTGSVLFSTNIPPDKLGKDDLARIYRNVLFFNSENIDTNHVYGFTQLSEIAVKSLSPGINDPGIAVICLQFLADLFVNLYSVKHREIYADDEEQPRIRVKNIGFEGLLTITLTPIRHYGKEDLTIARSLLNLLLLLGEQDQKARLYPDLINQHADAVVQAIKKTLMIPADAQPINGIIDKMQQISPPYFSLRKLEIE